MDFSNFEDIGRFLDDLDEMMTGKRPRGTKRATSVEYTSIAPYITNPPVDTSKTVEELALSELMGKPVKIAKKDGQN